MRHRLGLLLPALLLWIPPAAAAPPTHLEIVAIEGGPSPDGQGTIRSILSGLHLNDRGDVGFTAGLEPSGTPDCAYVHYSGGGFDAVCEDDAPPPEFGSHYSFLTAPAVSRDREFAMTVGGVRNGWVRKSGGTVSLLAREGDPVPGRPGYTYDWNPTEFEMNGPGRFLLATEMQGPAGWSNGIVLIDEAGHDVVAINGDPAPTPGADPFSYVSEMADLNDAGDVAFYGEVANLEPGRGFFARLGGTLTLVALEGDPAPVSTGQFLEFPSTLPPSINDAGTVVFTARLGPCCAALDSGVFRWDHGALTAVALAGDPVPGSPERVFVEVGGGRICDAGAIAFLGASYPPDNHWTPGIYWYENGTTTKLIEANVPVPGTGASIGDFDWSDLRINERGDVAFQASLTNGGRAIFLFTSHTSSVPSLGPGPLGLLLVTLGAVGWRCSAAGRRRPGSRSRAARS